MNMHLPALPPNIVDIVEGHDKALELYRDAFTKIEEAHAAIEAAFEAVASVTPGAQYHAGIDGDEERQFHKAVTLPKREDYMATAAKILTLRCWHYVVDKCGLQQLMDSQAKKELDASLRYTPVKARNRYEVIDEEEISKGPPPFTVENVKATIATFAGQADMIWQRGIATAFSALDRRFRSHDGFKAGSRIILSRMVSSSWSGRIDEYGEQAERFRDIERAFRILDGVDPKHAQSTFLHHVNKSRGHNPHQSEHLHEYFKIRIFQNGNAHLWFTRKDLVEKVNKVLAAYYGEVIGDANTKEEDIFESRALTPARAFGFFPTNPDLSEKIAKHVRYRNNGKPMRILEPSAGTGNLAAAIAQPFKWHGRYDEPDKTLKHVVDCVEIQPKLAAVLRATYPHLNSITATDFLKMKPTLHKLYDGVLMNPPFDRERDIDHVTHAMKFLKPDGWLVAIMSAGTEFRETRKAGAFRKLIADKKGWMVDLPAGSFADVGTNVNTMLVGWGISAPSTYHW